MRRSASQWAVGTAIAGALLFAGPADSALSLSLGGNALLGPGEPVDVAPVVTTQPIGRTVTVGATVSFTAVASGTPSPTVQWQSSANSGTTWSDIGGATSTTYSFTATLADSGKQYRAIFTNSAGSVSSFWVGLTVTAVAPSITTQPSNQTVVAGGTAAFTVTVAGTPPFTYRWLKDGAPIPGATTATLTLTNVQWELSHLYAVSVGNAAGTVLSTSARLKVTPPPSFHNMYSVPSDVTAIRYPDDYLGQTPQSVLIDDPYCSLTQNPVSYPASYLDASRLPQIVGAPFPPSVKRAVWLFDMWNPAPMSGSQVAGCPEPGPNGALRAAYVESVKRIAAMGGDYVGLTQTFTIASGPDPAVATHQTLGLLEDDFAFVTTEARKAGVDVIVWYEWGGDIGTFTDLKPPSAIWYAAFIKRYAEYLLAEARLAERYGVKVLMVSNYLDLSADIPTYLGLFNTEVSRGIAEIRKVYTGQIMLGDFYPSSDMREIADVCKAVDIVMTGPTVVLPRGTTSFTMDDLRRAYGDYFRQWFLPRYGRFGKPVYLFAPISSLERYLSDGGIDDGYCLPGCPQLALKPDFASQAMGFEALFEVAAQAHAAGEIQLAMVGPTNYYFTDPLMPAAVFYGSGMFPSIGSNIRNKPAESIMAAWSARYALSSGGASYAAPGGLGSVNVDGGTRARNHVWSVTSHATWVTLTSPAGGSGRGTATVTYTVAPNTGAAARTATLTIAGQSFTITQEGLPSAAPAITTHPANRTVGLGQTASFTAAASGTPTPTVQWQVSTDGGSSYAPISVAVSGTYAFTTVASDSGKQFRAVFTNSVGSATTTAATLTVVPAPAAGAPFGQVDTPAQHALGVQGAIGVTGWVLDDSGVAGVKIYRDCVPFDNPASCQMQWGYNVVYIGDGAFVPGARPDVEAAYPGYPQGDRAGWGYLMLTNMLPHMSAGNVYGGQGALNLYAIATAGDGEVRLLGRSSADSTPTSITMDNDHIAKPFGAIDTPGQGETIGGASFANFGWVLTRDADTTAGAGDVLIPPNGSTTMVFIDGQPVAPVAYNQCRGTAGNPVPAGTYCNDDVANVFGNPTPQPVFTTRTSNPTRYRNLDAGRGAIGAHVIDTTKLSNGMHSIAWSVGDSAGAREGIGSRNFTVLNTGADVHPGPGIRDPGSGAARQERLGWDQLGQTLDVRTTGPRGANGAPNDAGATGRRDGVFPDPGARVPDPGLQARGRAADLAGVPVSAASVRGRVGFDLVAPFEAIAPDAEGVLHVSLPELSRVELQLGRVDEGYFVANGELRDLPVGSHLDREAGRFTWAPGPGFLGIYRFAFVRGGEQVLVDVTVGISIQGPRH